MMGDRDYRSIVQNAIDSIGRELDTAIDPQDVKKIHLKEIVGCMRRAYYDRRNPLDAHTRGFSELLSGLLRKMQYGCKPQTFAINEDNNNDSGDGIILEGRADMIADDDVVILFRPFPAAAATGVAGNRNDDNDNGIDSPQAADALYLNACMWIYGKENGIVVYMSGGHKETMFSLARNKKMFEETVRRTRVLANLLKENNTPILEPSAECAGCQYYERCYTTRRNTKQISLHEMFGLGGKSKD